jgi:hypothetical protein
MTDRRAPLQPGCGESRRVCAERQVHQRSPSRLSLGSSIAGQRSITTSSPFRSASITAAGFTTPSCVHSVPIPSSNACWNYLREEVRLPEDIHHIYRDRHIGQSSADGPAVQLLACDTGFTG